MQDVKPFAVVGVVRTDAARGEQKRGERRDEGPIHRVTKVAQPHAMRRRASLTARKTGVNNRCALACGQVQATAPGGFMAVRGEEVATSIEAHVRESID